MATRTRLQLSLVAAGICVPLIMAADATPALAWDAPAGSPPGWQPHWVQTVEPTQLFASASDDLVVGEAAAHTFFRIDAPAQARRVWVYNPLNSGWAWLPVASTRAASEPTLEQVLSAAEPPNPRDYLYQRAPDLAPRLDCIIAGESGWDPAVRNPRSSASGLAQFLPGTWAATPQGQLGLSPFDPLPNIDAAIWLAQTRGWSQWQVFTAGGCHT